jgi:hypothetical protein
LSIPLSGRRFDDFWAWHYDRQGVFSVRSAYRMLVKTREKREAWLEKRPSSSHTEVIVTTRKNPIELFFLRCLFFRVVPSSS